MIRVLRNLKYAFSLSLIGSVFLFASCSCDEDCAEFSNFQMCDVDPLSSCCTDNTIVFEQDADHLTYSVEIKHGEPNDILSTTFFFKQGGSFSEITTHTIALKDIDEEVDGSERKVKASTGLIRKQGELWPIGEYKVEVELSQENIPVNVTQNFTVE